MSVRTARDGAVLIVTIDRPEVRNAVDRATAAALADTFRIFDADRALSVAVLTGAGGAFCAGADLKGVATGSGNALHDVGAGDGPMGPSRMMLSKPVIAAVEGPAVAGGLELAVWCDLRVAAASAMFGVFCRRWGVPLIDGGTVRLPRLIGQARALEMILTGRAVSAQEALAWGLANRVVPDGEALTASVALAHELAHLPQTCLRNDRRSALTQWSLTEDEAMAMEFGHGRATLASGEAVAGAVRFSAGAGRGGAAA